MLCFTPIVCFQPQVEHDFSRDADNYTHRASTVKHFHRSESASSNNSLCSHNSNDGVEFSNFFVSFLMLFFWFARVELVSVSIQILVFEQIAHLLRTSKTVCLNNSLYLVGKRRNINDDGRYFVSIPRCYLPNCIKEARCSNSVSVVEGNQIASFATNVVYLDVPNILRLSQRPRKNSLNRNNGPHSTDLFK